MPEDAYVDGGPAPPSFDSVWAILMEGVKKNPDGPAIIVIHQPNDHHSALLSTKSPHSSKNPQCLQWTYRQLQGASLRVAGALRTRGVTQGQTLVTFVENSVEWPIIVWAAARLGLTVAALDARMPERAAELRNTVELLNPDVLLVQNRTVAQNFDGLDTSNCVRLVCNGEADVGWQSLEALDAAHGEPLSDTVDFISPDPDHPVAILFTSGTTNKPKGCPRTIAAISMQSYAYAMSWRIDATSRFLLHSPNFRAICEHLSLACWRVGAAVVLPSERFEPDATLSAIISHKCTHVVMVPAQLYALRRSPILRQLPTKMLQNVFIGGDIVSSDIIQMSKESFRPIWTGPSHGMTEGGGTFSWCGEQEIPTTEGGIAGLGRVLPGTRIRICAPGSTTLVRRGEKGDLHLSSPPIITHYLDNRDPGAFYMDNGAMWFKTGDLATMDDSGVIFILGRTKDIIKCKGFGMSPAVFEGCLNRLPGIESQVIGVPHPEFGHVPVAVIKCKHGLDTASKNNIRRAVAQELGDEYTLANIYTLHDLHTNDWPMNSTGKVVKENLRKLVESL